MTYKWISTDYDTMHEIYLQEAELEERFGFPILDPVHVTPDFSISLPKSAKNLKTKNTIVHCYVEDSYLEPVWKDARRYVDNLRYYPYMVMPDLTVTAFMPPAMQVWNRFRNMALARYFHDLGIPVVPSLGVLSDKDSDFMLYGMPEDSTVSVSTKGRLRQKEEHQLFMRGLYHVLDVLKPRNLLMFGSIPSDWTEPLPTSYFETEGIVGKSQHRTAKEAERIAREEEERD